MVLNGLEQGSLMPWILVKTASEISLKSKFVRRHFFDQLCGNIEKALRANRVQHGKFVRRPGRILFETGQEKKAFSVLRFVYGIHAFALAEKFAFRSLEELSEKAAGLSSTELKKAKTFAVRCTRSGVHSFSSQEAAAKIGGAIGAKNKKLKVDLDHSQKEVFVEISDNQALVYFGEERGSRGLPVGVSGIVGIELSGKKEEVIAGKAMLKRGCSLVVKVTNAKKCAGQLKELEKWNSFHSLERKGKVEAWVVPFKDVKKALKELQDKKEFKLAPLVFN